MLRVNEVFTSLQGEADGFGEQGQVTTFVRLQGCNLQCKWCDTQHAQALNAGRILNVDMVYKMIEKQACPKVTITGGEPLLQLTEVEKLVNRLAEKAYRITIETNGSLLIPKSFCVYARACISLRYVVDYKLGSSKMTDKMKPEVFRLLRSYDVIKFVIKNLEDYQEAVKLCKEEDWVAKKVFSPVLPQGLNLGHSLSWPVVLAKQILEDNLDGVALSLQIHKLLVLQ